MTAKRDLFSGIVVGETLVLDGIITPPEITADVDNYDPDDLGLATFVRLTSDAARNISGVAAQGGGRTLVLMNVGSFPLVLLNESSLSTAGNRFALGLNVVLDVGASLLIWYDGASSRWRRIESGTQDESFAPPDAKYVLTEANEELPNAIVRGWLENFFRQTRPATPTSWDDEFDDSLDSSGEVNGLDAKWTWRNQGGATVTFSKKGYLTLTSPADSQQRIIEQTLPAGSWAFEAKFSLEGSNIVVNSQAGMVLIDSVNGDLYTFSLLAGNINTYLCSLQPLRYNSVSSFNSAIAPLVTAVGNSVFMRIAKAATTITVYLSHDGISWLRTHSFTDAVGVDRIGLTAAGNASGAGIGNFEFFRRSDLQQIVLETMVSEWEMQQVATGVPPVVAEQLTGTGDADTATVTKPTSTVEGDHIVVAIARNGTGAITPPDVTWVEIGTESGDRSRQSVFEKIAGGAEPASYDFTFGGTERFAWASHRITGADDPPDGASSFVNTGFDTTPDAPSVLTATPCLVLRTCAESGDGGIGVAAGLVDTFDLASGSGSLSNIKLAGGWETQVAPGATGVATFSKSNNGVRATTGTVALRGP